VITPPTFHRHRRVLQTAPVLVVEGPLQRVDGVTHVQGRRFHAVTIAGEPPPSHDFH
jgi:hypothetical protein